jgi:hypothetical protein
MYSKYTKKSILFLSLVALLLPLLISSTFLKNINERYLQTQNYIKYTGSGIYYKIDYPKNDITGTGDILQDSPYRALCIVKQCSNICCLGDINSLTCGTREQCQQFYDTSVIPNVVGAVLGPLIILAIFLIAYFCFLTKSNKKCLSALLALACIFIITIPFVLFFIWKRKLFSINFCGDCNDCKPNEVIKYFLFFN